MAGLAERAQAAPVLDGAQHAGVGNWWPERGLGRRSVAVQPRSGAKALQLAAGTAARYTSAAAAFTARRPSLARPAVGGAARAARAASGCTLPADRLTVPVLGELAAVVHKEAT